MNHLFLNVIVLLTIVGCFCNANNDAINTDLVNTNVVRTVDLTTHLPKITSTITLENTGSSAVRFFLVAVEASLSSHLSFVGAVIKADDENTQLDVHPTNVAAHKDKTFYRVQLAEPLKAGSEVTVDVDTVFSHTLKPFPSAIAQAEKQLVRFSGNLYFYSPYKTTNQTTTVNLASSSIESYTKTKPVSVSDSTINYGHYGNKPEFSEGEMTIHFENNSPFLSVTDMTRLIEVSHWGNIAIEETLDLLHTGATLKGSFSRYDYQRSQDGAASIKSFKTILPSSARDVYYRDEIGNISTSHLRELDEMVEVELRPRFPLFGGWKTHYMLGYNVPSYQYLYNRGDNYILKMRFVDHVFDDQVIDSCTLKVILPEGAKNIKLVAPFDVNELPRDTHYTYLDTMGRPVVTARKSNLAENHIQEFELHYTFSKMMLIQEPLLVIGAFYLLFLMMIIYVRLDFSITKDEASESRMRVTALIEEIQTVQDRRSALYQSYEDAINKFKSSKDATSFNANRKKIDADHKQLTQQIAGLLVKLKSEGADALEKISELQRLDTQVREQITVAIQFAEKLVAGKISKTQYLDMESTTKTKKEDIYQKMENILASL